MSPGSPIVDFLIVGTMKSGTSSLGFHLERHEEICLPARELHFFDRPEALARGAEGYAAELRRGLAPGHRIVGEKTPSYSYVPEAAARIHAMAPGARLVWSFRHPVDRAYSNYLHALSAGNEWLPFERAIALEAERARPDPFLAYLERSRYWKQLDRFLALFPREQMHFVLFEDFTADPRGELRRLFAFLGVDPDRYEHRDEVRNPTRVPRFPRMLHATRRWLGPGLPLRAARWLNTLGRSRGYAPLDPELRARLARGFREDNARLAERIGRSLELWDET